ncbi:glycosyltransferase involved in cell wall biosynthesis [Caulobacter ginsengisoli]|uniref:Glycosyltransferase involved in cell wall biosynthesis n=1 Tax=Caulobacter ginsengisoli TaxID=400775 RepID=A0ABU0IQZ1_9CAUL|nr:glycosyltransferase [Caulobacter ginsengisoli]MDQ0463439.1 glycosyltransferase involved in cell wall biosynthesis [Caulobacter ginsengisoli]
MSVLHLLGSNADGGAETYFVDLVTALSRAGLSEACAIRPHAGREQALTAAGLAVKTFGFGSPLDLLTRPGIASFAKARQARVLVAWMNRAAKHTPKGPWARIGRLGGYYKLKNYRGFEALVGNTRDIVDWMVREGWPADRAHYIPNFAEAPADGAPVDRASLDTPSDVPLLLSMGRLHSAKAHDISLQALRAIPGAYLWIAGAGPLEDQLKTLAGALGLGDRVRFLGWRNDPSALYGAADLCLFPSRFEPLGNTVIQAWAHGLPVVAAASQGPAALIRDGDDGLLVPIDDAEALAARTNALLADPMLRIRLIQNGHARVEAEFSQAAILGQWRALFAQYGAS